MVGAAVPPSLRRRRRDASRVARGLGSLACPVGVGLMMWTMMRGQRSGNNAAGAGSASPVRGGDQSSQVAALRTEIEQLKADRAARPVSGG